MSVAHRRERLLVSREKGQRLLALEGALGFGVRGFRLQGLGFGVWGSGGCGLGFGDKVAPPRRA
jgi:hypothetical protein